jgi:hypothetical protein
MPQDPNNNPQESPPDISDSDSEGTANGPKSTGEPKPPKEIGGRPGPDPTRYGDWEKNGRCIDF